MTVVGRRQQEGGEDDDEGDDRGEDFRAQPSADPRTRAAHAESLPEVTKVAITTSTTSIIAKRAFA